MIFAPFAFRNQVVAAAAPATATFQYELFTNGFSGTFNVYKNGSLLQSMTTDTSLVTVTLNAGDTFYSTIQQPGGNGATVDYFLNGSFVTSYLTFLTTPLTTPTVTAAGGNTYKYTGNLGAV
jgi:hypothetical protein